MFDAIQNKLEQELKQFIRDIDRRHSLSRISPVLFRHIKEFLLRKGKRLRPTLFVVGYLGFSRKAAPCLYTSALSLELLHDYMLVHDDIIDKSDTRRGKPSMHVLLDRYLRGFNGTKCSGQDLALVLGDVMYALGIYAFLSIKEDAVRKEKALRKFIEAAMYTGSGEFIELLAGLKPLDDISREDIYRIYDFKTAYYSFAAPLAMGAILGGASDRDSEKLFTCGLYLGRAFQIKDDILGSFGEEKQIGKPHLSDLQEAKKTILVWYAYRHAAPQEKRAIQKIFAKKKVDENDLKKMRAILSRSGALDYAKKEVTTLTKKAQQLLLSCRMHTRYKIVLGGYSKELLRI